MLRPPPSIRVPDVVVTPRGSVWDTLCRRCRIPVRGLPTESAAHGWAQRHQCPDDPGYRLENKAWDRQTREERAR